MEESKLKVDCNGAKVPAWIMSRGKKLHYDRPAFIDDEGRSPMSQMRADECVIAPGAIYREEAALLDVLLSVDAQIKEIIRQAYVTGIKDMQDDRLSLLAYDQKERVKRISTEIEKQISSGIFKCH